jgi:hypothetical protein
MSFIGPSAFSFCDELKSIVIPWTVESIQDHCFHQCCRLRTVTFDSGGRLSVLGLGAFAWCSSLEAICIPSSVTRIEDECFMFCSRLATVTVEPGSRVWDIGRYIFAQCSPSLSLPPLLIRSPIEPFRLVVNVVRRFTNVFQ